MDWLVPYNLDELLAPARIKIGRDRYEQLFAAGKAMSLEDAVAYALEEQDE